MVSPDLIVIKRWSLQQFAWLGLAALLALLIMLAIGYRWGIKDGISLFDENQKLTGNVEQLNTQLGDSNRQLLIQKQISKVDQAANFHAGNSMDEQLHQIRSLERELKFFRSIMAPEESVKGLQISRFNWQQPEQGVFNWQLSLIQAGSQGRAVSGVVKVHLIAMSGGKETRISLTDEQQKSSFSYRFKYFQHISGTITLADDVTPIRVNIVAKPAINGQQSVEKQFPWQPDEEKIANVE
ncbi:MAG: hypothetical protein DRQ47_04900 [Gammaproteobacteria bacterium]|nr:MAG: hypothetical protein DRQ47_04900 [Gammaproteobacteria bacterium]